MKNLVSFLLTLVLVLSSVSALAAYNDHTDYVDWPIVTDGEKLTVDCLMCAICNGKAYGGGFLAAPEAVPDDGWMDVVIIRKVGRLTIAKLLGMYKRGGHFVHGQLTEQAKPYFIYRRAKQVTLRPVDGRGPIVATADGECAPCDRVEIALHPQSARILLPKAAYERFCAQRENAASAGTR